ncbi:MAG: hypothetical protein OXS47_08790 [Chloroflexota bacterium]|nr:hypothetical protein [Chloroflexota bacterium]
MFLGLVTPAVNGTDGAALLVQEGASIVGSGTWASLYLLTCSGALLAWMWWTQNAPLWARIVLTVPGGIVLLIAAMQGSAVSSVFESYREFGGEDVGLGPAYWLLGAGGAVLFLSSALASLSDYAPDYSISITRSTNEQDDD